MSDRINARLPKPLADHVNRMVGQNSLYETPSEYIRSLIRQDMQSDMNVVYDAILEGFDDIAAGRVVKSTGDWSKDKAAFLKRVEE